MRRLVAAAFAAGGAAQAAAAAGPPPELVGHAATPLLDGCTHAFLDLGANAGVQTRKLHQPKLYARSSFAVWKSKFYGALVLNHRVVLHVIDATPARWRDDAGSLPLDGASTAASSPRNDLVHPKHWLISTQAASCGGTTGRRRSRTSATRCGPCSTRPRRRCPSGTSVFGVVFVFDLWRGVDGATRREAHGVGTRRRSVAALASERRRHRRDSPFALHRSRTCTSASSGYRSRTPRATGAPPSRSTSRSRRPRRS